MHHYATSIIAGQFAYRCLQNCWRVQNSLTLGVNFTLLWIWIEYRCFAISGKRFPCLYPFSMGGLMRLWLAELSSICQQGELFQGGSSVSRLHPARLVSLHCLCQHQYYKSPQACGLFISLCLLLGRPSERRRSNH